MKIFHRYSTDASLKSWLIPLVLAAAGFLCIGYAIWPLDAEGTDWQPVNQAMQQTLAEEAEVEQNRVEAADKGSAENKGKGAVEAAENESAQVENPAVGEGIAGRTVPEQSSSEETDAAGRSAQGTELVNEQQGREEIKVNGQDAEQDKVQDEAQDKVQEQQKGIGVSGLTDINHADKQQLMELPGIGEAKAEAIIKYRDQNGGFDQIEELMEVKGIGPKVFAKLSDQITIILFK